MTTRNPHLSTLSLLAWSLILIGVAVAALAAMATVGYLFTVGGWLVLGGIILLGLSITARAILFGFGKYDSAVQSAD